MEILRNSLQVLLSFFLLCSVAVAGTNPPKDVYDLKPISHYASQDLKPWIKFVAVKTAAQELEIFLIPDDQATFHAEFVKAQIRKDLSLDQINRAAQYHERREFFFGTLFLGRESYLASEQRSIFQDAQYDLVSKDFPTAEDVSILDAGLKSFLQLVIKPSALQYSPLGKFGEATEAQSPQFENKGISLVAREEFRLRQQIYTPGWALGKVRRLTAAESDRALDTGVTYPGEILVIDGAPSDLPLAEGYILSLPTSPNSHPALLAKMTGAPLIFQKNAYQESKILELEKTNQTCLLFVKDPESNESSSRRGNIYLGSIDDSGQKELQSFKSKKQLGSLKISPDVKDILETAAATSATFDSGAYGSKARGLVQIQKSVEAKYTIPSLFVPIYYQSSFFDRSFLSVNQKNISLRDFIADRLKNWRALSTVELATHLAEVRNAILTAKTSEGTFTAVAERIIAFAAKNGAKKVFLRSSSNAEDGDVFNGAGLYDSKSAALDSASIEKSLRTVWASLYNFKAYFARSQFGIDESTVGMAVVVQGFLQEIQGQGVFVAKYDSTRKISKVNFTSLPGSMQVTTPPPGVSPEQVEVENYAGDRRYYIHSTCLGCGDLLRLGETVLTQTEYLDLATQADKLLANDPRNLDVEWLKSNGQVHIVQVRTVPSSQTIPHTILVGTEKAQFHRHRIDGDSEDPAILKIRGEIQLQLKLKSQRSFGKDWIESLTYSYQGTKVSIAKDELRITEFTSENQRKKLTIQLNHPAYPSLALEIHRPQYSDQPDPNSVSEILTPMDYEFALTFDGEKYFPKSERKLPNAYSYGDMNFLNPFKVTLDFNAASLTTNNRENAVFVGLRKDQSPIKVHVSYDKDNDEKHYNLLLKKISIENLFPGEVMEFSKLASMVYTAKDHHLSPELAIDLTLNNAGLPLPENTFKGARYLWIFSSGVNPNAKEKDEADWGFGGMALIGANGEWIGELTQPKQDSVTESLE